jgi:hypothetical protein
MIFWMNQRGGIMATERANDLRAFKGFIEEKLSNGGADLTLDEALVHWDIENQTDEERQDTLRAIGDGLADVEAGQTRPVEEFDREFRSKHGLPARS